MSTPWIHLTYRNDSIEMVKRLEYWLTRLALSVTKAEVSAGFEALTIVIRRATQV